jgi:hypothetical protein
MTINSDLILRQAQVQRLTLDPNRAVELAEEARALIDNAFVASEAAIFEDDPDRFLSVLWELRDR